MERRVLVTGASSGIGLATALHLAELGFRVVASARTREKAALVEDAAGRAAVDLETAVLDVADPATYEDLVPRLDLWALVNNAGYMNLGTIEDVPPDTVRRQFETLVFGPIRLIQLALPAMRRRGDGRIIMVTSAAAHATGPVVGWYGAAKHAMAAAIEALRPELATWSIDVVAIEPGGFRTGIWDRAEADLDVRALVSNTPQVYERSLAILQALRPRMPGPEKVAAVIGEALRAGRPRAIYRVGWDVALLSTASHLVPPGTKDKLVRRILQL